MPDRKRNRIQTLPPSIATIPIHHSIASVEIHKQNLRKDCFHTISSQLGYIDHRKGGKHGSIMRSNTKKIGIKNADMIPK
jgi:hypothetical protein